MIYKIIINKDDNLSYKLCSWDSVMFNSNFTFELQCEEVNFQQIKSDFSNIETIDVYKDDTLIATYANLDSFTQLAYIGNVYVPHEGISVDCIRITMEKKDLVSLVETLNKQVNNIVDEDAMSVEELKSYRLKQISQACREDIYAGDTIAISQGEYAFSYTAEDQINLANAMSILMQDSTIEQLPYHANGYPCELMPSTDVVVIYMTLQLRLTRLTTYCNLLNVYVNSMTNKSDLKSAHYGMELPSEYQNKLDEIYNNSVHIMQSLLHKLMPTEENLNE